MVNDVSETENRERNFIPYGGKLAVIHRDSVLTPMEYEKMLEASKKLMDEWNSINSVTFKIPSLVLRGDKDD